MTRRKWIAASILSLVLAGAVFAQQGGFGGGGGRGFGGGGGNRGFRGGGGMRGGAMPDLAVDRRGVESWDVDEHFKNDVFTFVRLIYTSTYRRGGGGNWYTDFPDSDLNFSLRLQQMTSLKVDPVPKQIRITDDTLFDYPFVYMLEIGGLEFTEEEIPALRKYLLNGGVLMVDDHWGVDQYENFHEEMRRVFPEREPVELDLSHPIFHCVFDLKEKPQVPSIEVAIRNRNTGITWEREDAKEPHFRAIYDDKGRIMVLICSNTDLGDGWEREGEDEWFFHEFSEKKAYPMGVNIIFYAMTH